MDTSKKIVTNDTVSSTKKKKELDNHMSYHNSLTVDWTQKNEFVTVTVILGHSYDNKNVRINSEPHSLEVFISDDKKFSVQLYERIEPEATDVMYKCSKCIIKLLKSDPNIMWKSLQALPPSVDQKRHLPPQNDINSCMDDEKKEEGELMPDIKIVQVLDPKTGMVERDGDTALTLYLYVKKIKKDSIASKLTSSNLVFRFSTNDPRFYSCFPNANEDTVFEWNAHLKGAVIENEWSYKVSQSNVEFKLLKKEPEKWGVLVHAAASVEGSQQNVVTNTWLTPNCSSKYVSNNSVNLSSVMASSSIPPAPPVPEVKKPTCLIAPASKGIHTPHSSVFSPTNVPFDESSSNLYPKGLCGLDNIGNTCFMNSVLQCLVNTRELREYFTEYNFQDDINKENPLGMGGNLALSFAVLVKTLWSQKLRSYTPSKLKSMMSMKANQFSGFAQHDAQEFMVELLDGLHEDLNQVKKKPYIADPPDLDGWADHEAADEAWRLHKMRNDSIINDLFKGQFKSTLTCHECGKISVKFDEFCCLSVPIPKDQKIIPVTFFWKEPHKKPKKFFVRVCADATFDELKTALAEKAVVAPANIRVFEVYNSKIHKIFSKSAVPNIASSDTILAFEVYNPAEVGEPVIELYVTQRMMTPTPPTKCGHCSRHPSVNGELKMCTRCYRVGYCGKSCQTSNWSHHRDHCYASPEPIGCPFVVSIPESLATYSNLTRVMDEFAVHSVDVFQPPVSQMTEARKSRGSISSGDISNDDSDEMEVDGEEGSSDMPSGSAADITCAPSDNEGDWGSSGVATTSSPSQMSMEHIPSLSLRSSSQPVHHRGGLQLAQGTGLFTICHFNPKGQYIGAHHGEVIEDKGDHPLDLNGKQNIALDWKTHERLPVYCLVQNKEIECDIESSVQALERNQTTSLDACIDLFTQPENITEGDLWRCPRCKKPVESTKQMGLWRLPKLLIVQLKRFSFKYIVCSDKIDKYVDYPIRSLDIQPYMSRDLVGGSPYYDLYGVINHMGRLLGGHYTSYARTVDADDTRDSEVDWRIFDDSRVNFITESRVVSEQAYLLLYCRRDTPFVLPRRSPPSETASLDSTSSPDVTPMSVSSSQEGDETPQTLHEELD